MVVHFTKWICRLDRKRRFVLPEEVRRSLGLEEFALIELEGDRLVVRKANGELARARPISRNLFEVSNAKGLRGVMGAQRTVDPQDRFRLPAKALRTG